MSPDAASEIDKGAIRAKYLQERDKRLRPDGNAQYQRLSGRFAHYAVDPYLPVEPRDPVTDDVTVAIIGGGFRSEEHTSELQSLMRISYAVFCLKKKHHTAPTNKKAQQRIEPHTITKQNN